MSAGQVTSPNPVLDSTEDPFNPNSFSDVTGRDPETYQVRNDYTEHPGFVGFQLQDRPSISTLRIYNGSDSDDSNDSNIYGTELSVIQTGTPNASQVKVSATSGWCQTHIDNLNMYFIAVYDSRGTNNAFDSVDQRVESVVQPLINAAVDAAVDAVIATEVPIAVTSELAVYEFPYPPGHFQGLGISNDGTDPTNDIVIASGSARDATDAVNIDYAGGTIQTDVAFGTGNGSLDTGAVGDGTYHLWLIQRSDTGVSRVLSSLSASAPTMPANYDYKVYLWPIVRSSGAILLFDQIGRRFDLRTPVMYSTGANPGTSRITATMSAIPTGIQVIALLQVGLNGATVNTIMTARPMTETDAAPLYTAFPFFDVFSYNVGDVLTSNEMQIRTTTSAEIAIRLSASGSGQTGYVLQKGWIV